MKNDSSILIRVGNLKDIPNLITLWKGQYDYHHSLDPVYYVPNSKDLEEKFREYLKKAVIENDPYIQLAEAGSKLIGFITYELVEASYLDANIVEHGDVIEIYVNPEYRSKGEGKKLIEAAEEFCKNKGVEYVSVQCSVFNKNALDFYEKLGFINRQSSLYKKIR